MSRQTKHSPAQRKGREKGRKGRQKREEEMGGRKGMKKRVEEKGGRKWRKKREEREEVNNGCKIGESTSPIFLKSRFQV